MHIILCKLIFVFGLLTTLVSFTNAQDDTSRLLETQYTYNRHVTASGEPSRNDREYIKETLTLDKKNKFVLASQRGRLTPRQVFYYGNYRIETYQDPRKGEQFRLILDITYAKGSTGPTLIENPAKKRKYERTQVFIVEFKRLHDGEQYWNAF